MLTYARLQALPRAAHVLFWLGTLALVAFLGGLPGTIQPEIPGESWPYLSNLLHQPLYALVGLGFLLLLRLPSERRHWAWAAGYALCIGILDEVHQAHTEARSSSLWDLGSDGYGAYCAGIVAHLASAPGWMRRAFPRLVGMILLGLAWNCLPTFAPKLPLPFLG